MLSDRLSSESPSAQRELLERLAAMSVSRPERTRVEALQSLLEYELPQPAVQRRRRTNVRPSKAQDEKFVRSRRPQRLSS